MSDTLEPPAKRARFEIDADVPGSPVDDLDDDFYDTPAPVNPLPHSVNGEASPASAVAAGAASAPSLQLPGLGLLSAASDQHSTVKQTSVKNDEEPSSVQVSDSESLYNEGNPDGAAPAPVAQNAQGAGSAPAARAPEDGEVPAAPAMSSPTTQPSAEIDHAKEEFLRAAEANKGNANAEWELDSQASDASSESSSDDSDDSSDEEDSDEGELLDPEEQVRLLMMEAADEGPAGPAKVRTVNEVAEVFEKPDITVTETTKKTELGKIESIVDNMVVIKAKTSGDYQVLESGSALCLGDGTVIGKVAETLGRVQEPRYSVGFSDPAEISTLGLSKDTPVYFVDEHSTFVFTEPLKAQKFTDASNLHDEEAGDVEFSDDEKEAEFKRKQKEMKRAKYEAKNEGKSEVNRDASDKPQHAPNNDVPSAPQANQYQGGGLNYGDDDDDDLGMYKPLARPEHYENIVGAGAPLEDRSHVRRGNMRGRGGWPDRGRGFRGRGRGGGDGGARGRGNHRGNQRGGFAGVPTGPQGGAGPQGRGGRHQDNNRAQNHQHKENRSASSASPNRQRGRAAQQHSSPRANKKRQHQQHTSPVPASASPAPTSTNAYAQNAAPASTNAYTQNTALNSTAWSVPNTAVTPQPSFPYTVPQPAAIPAGAYVNPAFYGQAAAPQNPQQQNIAQWTQWLQLAAAMSQSQNQQQPQPQPVAPTQNTYPPPSTTQGGTPSLQDILRTLGGGGPQNR
jgi:H/ACA ribonucleoprotein complex non-core subunit NAF1